VVVAKVAVGPVEAAWLSHKVPAPIPISRPVVAATKPLPPLPTTLMWSLMGERVARRLPAGSVLAASEVGSIGGLAPQVAIIDMAGLNDREIAMHGFSADRLLRRRPDLIWLPHHDYTGANAELLGNAQFRQDYALYVGAFNYGIAIRKEGPLHARIEDVLRRAWAETYPGYDIDAYVAEWPMLAAPQPVEPDPTGT